MALDYAFFSANSGLTPASSFTLNDHMLAWARNKTALPLATIDDALAVLFSTHNDELTWLRAQTGVPGLTLDDQRNLYYTGGGSQPSAGFGNTAFGTGSFGA